MNFFEAQEKARQSAPVAAPVERDALNDVEDVAAKSRNDKGRRVGDEQMVLVEFRAAICALSWLLCKGKTLQDRLDMFIAQHVKD